MLYSFDFNDGVCIQLLNSMCDCIFHNRLKRHLGDILPIQIFRHLNGQCYCEIIPQIHQFHIVLNIIHLILNGYQKFIPAHIVVQHFTKCCYRIGNRILFINLSHHLNGFQNIINKMSVNLVLHCPDCRIFQRCLPFDAFLVLFLNFLQHSVDTIAHFPHLFCAVTNLDLCCSIVNLTHLTQDIIKLLQQATHNQIDHHNQKQPEAGKFKQHSLLLFDHVSGCIIQIGQCYKHSIEFIDFPKHNCNVFPVNHRALLTLFSVTDSCPEQNQPPIGLPFAGCRCFSAVI